MKATDIAEAHDLYDTLSMLQFNPLLVKPGTGSADYVTCKIGGKYEHSFRVPNASMQVMLETLATEIIERLAELDCEIPDWVGKDWRPLMIFPVQGRKQ